MKNFSFRKLANNQVISRSEIDKYTFEFLSITQISQFNPLHSTQFSRNLSANNPILHILLSWLHNVCL